MENKKSFEFEVLDGEEARKKVEAEELARKEKLEALHKAGEEYFKTPEGEALLKRNEGVEIEFPEMQNKKTAEEAQAEELKKKIEGLM